MASTNPFIPTFGIMPPLMAGRNSPIEELTAAFDLPMFREYLKERL